MRKPPMKLVRSLAGMGILALAACSNPMGPRPGLPVVVDTAPPPIAREMRGVWIATVANIDWPSTNALSADAQRTELIDLLDRAASSGFNTVVFQIRPAGDAVYPSTLEPWASLLTGTQGTDPGYDPLAFAITEAHARGLELHAWINPFRAGNSKDSLTLAPTHVFNARRDLVRVYGTQLWFDPGEAEVHDHAMRVVTDIVRRYDIDAIHADDYFYPYQQRDSSGAILDFPDSGSYARSGSSLARDDWRRDNVDRFIERLYREVHQIKPTMKVGISPFGIWRPGNPSSVAGLDAYATIYADSRKWLQSGWIDYFVPQLYWAISAPQQSYPALYDWWLSQNTMGRHIWPGLAAYRVNNGSATAFSSTEIADQVKITRAGQAVSGHILFDATATLKRNPGAVAATLAPLYTQRALVPAMPWIDSRIPAAPSVIVRGRTVEITPALGEDVRWWYLRARTARGWTTRVLFGTARSVVLDDDLTRVLVNSVNQAGNAGVTAEWNH